MGSMNRSESVLATLEQAAQQALVPPHPKTALASEWRPRMEANPQTILVLCLALRDAQAEAEEMRTRAVMAEQHKVLSLLGRSSEQEARELDLREKVAVAELRAEQAEADLATARRERDESHTAVMVLHDQVMALERELTEAQARAWWAKTVCSDGGLVMDIKLAMGGTRWSEQKCTAMV